MFLQNTLRLYAFIMITTHCLSANKLACVRGETTLFSELSLSLEQGQCLHLTGANGSGKTSLLRILSGINVADQGHVLWDDQRIERSDSYYSDSLYLAHKNALKNELSAIENLRLSQRMLGFVNEDKLDDCLQQMGLLNKADLSVQQLSFGQRRRLAFARCLLKDYALWILDEPFTGIDSQGQSLVETLCLKHLQKGGMIVLTHHQQLTDSLLEPHLIVIALQESQMEQLK